MAVAVMAWVWEHSPYEGTRLLIHLALADFANGEGVCWPSQVSVARKARCSDRWVRDVIAEMTDDGMLEVLQSPSHGRGKIGRYRVVHSPPENRNSVPRKPELSAQKTGTPVPTNQKRTNDEPRSVADRAARTCPLSLCGGSRMVELEDGTAVQCECVLRSVS